MKIQIVVLVALAMSGTAQAQVVVQAASVQLQPQIGRDANGYTTCGIRAVVIDLKPTIVDAYDFSINLRFDLRAGTIKAGKEQTSKADFLKGKTGSKTVMPSPINFWIAKESEGKAMMPFKVIPADTPGYILARADFSETWKSISAIIYGERMQFATRYKNQGFDTVISFAGTLKVDEREPLISCFAGLGKRIQEAIDAEVKK